MEHAELGRIFLHPELGWCLYDNSGAAGNPGDNAYRSERFRTFGVER